MTTHVNTLKVFKYIILKWTVTLSNIILNINNHTSLPILYKVLMSAMLAHTTMIAQLRKKRKFKHPVAESNCRNKNVLYNYKLLKNIK